MKWIMLIALLVLTMPAYAMDKATIFSETWAHGMNKSIPMDTQDREMIMSMVDDIASCIGQQMSPVKLSHKFIKEYHQLIMADKSIGPLVDKYELESLMVNNLIREAEEQCGITANDGGTQ
jgi:hypothetical protein